MQSLYFYKLPVVGHNTHQLIDHLLCKKINKYITGTNDGIREQRGQKTKLI